MPIRADLAVRAKTVASLPHGAKVEVLRIRRTFAKIRDAQGNEGWLDGRHLLTLAQMQEYSRLKETAAKQPSQGKATVYDPLNIHIEPNRGAPSVAQIPAAGSVDVLTRTVSPRATYKPIALAVLQRPVPAKSATKPRQRSRDDEDEKPSVPPPPEPDGPPVPDNWLELSQTVLPEEDRRTMPTDDWTLVRAADGNAGWVLGRMLVMSIPDEVAQYAEGHRITSYFSLGEVDAAAGKKHHWLWTTLTNSRDPYDFDSFRVFIYSLRRNRFETAYIERNLVGYLPVRVHEVDVTEGGRTSKQTGFSIITQSDGHRVARTFAFDGTRARRISQTPVADEPLARDPAPAENPSQQKAAASTSLWSRWKQLFSR